MPGQPPVKGDLVRSVFGSYRITKINTRVAWLRGINQKVYPYVREVETELILWDTDHFVIRT